MRVRLEKDGATMSRELITVNGAAQSENIAFFGVGGLTQVAEIEIRRS